MDQQKLCSEVLRYQKTGVDVFFNMLAAVQQSGQLMAAKTLEQSPWIPQSSRKSYVAWLEECTRTTKILKDMVDRGYSEMDRFATADRGKAAAKDSAKSSTSLGKTKGSSEPSDTEVKTKSEKSEPVKPKVTRSKSTPSAQRRTTRKKAAPKKTSAKTKPAEEPVNSAGEETMKKGGEEKPIAKEQAGTAVPVIRNTDTKLVKVEPVSD
ncbi:MAG: hypothetical protein ACWGOX_14385 [Desulforhopalus sp.]